MNEQIHERVSTEYLILTSDAEATVIQSTRVQRFKSCHVGIYWKALAEYFRMSSHMQGFQSLFRFFVLAKLATSSVRVKTLQGAHLIALVSGVQ